jgi:hypothetical protein
MPRLRVPRPASLLAAALVVACGTTPTDVCACLRTDPHTLVYGRVTDAAGAAVANAIVRVETGPATCQALQVYGDARTDAAGEYRTFIFRAGAQADFCVRLVAREIVGDALRLSPAQQFGVTVPETFPADSVRRDMVIPAS